MAYERSKQWPLAEADFKAALALLPEEPRTESDKAARAHVLNYLAYSWVDMGMNIDESFVMLKRAVELQPATATSSTASAGPTSSWASTRTPCGSSRRPSTSARTTRC